MTHETPGFSHGEEVTLWKEDLFLKKYSVTVTAQMVKSLLSKGFCNVKNLKDPNTGFKFDAKIEYLKNEKGYWGYKIFKV